MNVSEISQIIGELFLIFALDNFYKKGYIDEEKSLFEIVVHELIQLGFGDCPAYIKSPQSDGLLLTTNELA